MDSKGIHTLLRSAMFLIVALVCASSATAMGPLETLQVRDLQVREILGNHKTKPSPEEDARLRDLVTGIVDMDSHTRESFGIYWNELDETKRREALQLVSMLLERSLLKGVYEHKSDRVQYVSERIDPANPSVATVLTVITRNEDRWEVRYRMQQSGSQWKIVDILLQGKSSVERNRSTFYKEIQSTGVAGLLEKLRKKVDKIP